MDTQPDLTGKVVIITGANRGIGKYTALELAKLGATIVMVCRNAERGQAALEEIKEASQNPEIHLFTADLSVQQEIRDFVNQFQASFQKLHVLINNAGIVLPKRKLTVDGIEYQLAVNYLAPFLLTHLLLPLLKASAPARIINVTSDFHKFASLDLNDLQSEKKYGAMRTYGKTKLALLLFTYELARRLEGTAVTVNALHPGAINTGIERHLNWFFRGLYSIGKPFMKSIKKGAETSIFLASSPEVEGVTGKYFIWKKEKKSSKKSYDLETAQKLWNISMKLTNLTEN
ncbi:MAG: SDR family oxidoreductase [Candidatus Helarchaeota archaeon]